MRLKTLIMSLLLVMPLYAVPPVSALIGPVTVHVEDGSLTAMALDAAAGEYTELWLEEHACDPLVFGEAYSELLSSMLPFSNPVAGIEKHGAVDILDLESGKGLSFIFRDGRLAAVYPLE